MALIESRTEHNSFILTNSTVITLTVFGYATCFIWFSSCFCFPFCALSFNAIESLDIWYARFFAAAVLVITSLMHYQLAHILASQRGILALCISTVICTLGGMLIPFSALKILFISLGLSNLIFLWRMFNIENVHISFLLISRTLMWGILTIMLGLIFNSFSELFILASPFVSITLFVVALSINSDAFFKDEKRPEVDQHIQEVKNIVNWKTRVFEVLLNTLAGIALFYLLVSAPQNTIIYLFLGGSLCLSALLVLALVKLSVRIDERMRLMILLIFIAPLLLAIPLLSQSFLPFIAACILAVALALKEMLNGRHHVSFSRLGLSYNFKNISTKDAEDCVGFFLGILIGYFVQLFSSNSLIFTLVFLALFYVVMVIILAIENSSVRSLQEQAGKWENSSVTADDATQAKISDIARRYKLSVRQAEVLGLLARGRNATYIAEKLYISKNTARTHIYTLFKVFGVHSQQELMDLVETTRFLHRT